MAYTFYEIEMPRQILCDAHRQRFATFGAAAEALVGAHTVQKLVMSGRITATSTKEEVSDLVESLGPFCCWLGEDVLHAIENELLASRPTH